MSQTTTAQRLEISASKAFAELDSQLESAKILLSHGKNADALIIVSHVLDSLFTMLAKTAGLFNEIKSLNISQQSDRLQQAKWSALSIDEEFWQLPITAEVLLNSQESQENQENQENASQDIEEFYWQIHEILKNNRHEFIKELDPKYELENESKRALSQKIFTRLSPLWIITLLIVFGVVAGSLLHVHSLSEIFRADAQLFWIDGSDEDFNHNKQKIFPVQIDGQWRTYQIWLDLPIKTTRIRIDPLNAQIDLVELSSVEFLDESGNQVGGFDLEESDKGWRRIKGQSTKGAGLAYRPKGADHLVISPEYDELEVKSIRVRMRLFNRWWRADE